MTHFKFLKIILVGLFVGAGLGGINPGYAASSPAPTSPGEAAAFKDLLDIPAQASPLPAKALFNGIARAGKRLVAVGQRGLIVYSDDQGGHWTQASVPVSVDLTAVSFPSPGHGWAVGHEGVVLSSTDGGTTWQTQLDGNSAANVITTYYAVHPLAEPDAARLEHDIKLTVHSAPDLPLLDVWFENETNGFIVGAFNLIFHTTDGGRNWVPWFDRTDNPRSLHFYGIRQIGEDLYICGEQGMVLKFNRETGRFVALAAPYHGTFFGLTGKPGVLIAYGMRGNICRSTDAGKTWQQIASKVPLGLVGGTVMADGRIVLVNQAGQFLVSTDNGVNFVPGKMGRPFPAASVVPLDQNTLVTTGFKGILKQALN